LQPAMHQQVTSPPAAKTTDAVAPAPAVAAPRRRKSRRRRYILIGIGALILLSIVGAVIASKREKPISVTTEKAAKRTILQLVSATGKVQPETEVKISPEVAGEIIDLPVIDGAHVNKGDLLVKVRPDSYKALLEAQEAAISSAKATNLQQKATMMKTEQDLKRADDMYSKKTISIQEYNTAQAAYDVAKTTY
jgi:HlyD family secretion protein